MPRKSSSRKSKKPKKRSKSRRNHAYEIVKPRAKLAPRSLIGLEKINEGTLLSILLLVVLAFLTSQFFTAHRFYVYEAEVKGNRFVSPDAIYDASGLHELSIFWVKPKQAEAAILDSLPGIKEARVTCRLPARVTIEVVERRTQIIWQRGQTRLGLDDLGVTIPLEGESQEGMLLIQDLRPGPLEVGELIGSEMVVSALELRRLIPETVALEYSEDQGLISHQWGYPVYFGTGDVARKIIVLNALRQDLEADGVQPKYVDVRFAESPSYSY